MTGQLTFEDYTLPLEAVMRAEGDRGPQGRIDDFCEWARGNRGAVEAIWDEARECVALSGYVSANYLTNWVRQKQRWIRPQGNSPYKVPNDFSPILGRYLQEDPEIGGYVKCKKSQYDDEGLEFPEIRRS